MCETTVQCLTDLDNMILMFPLVFSFAGLFMITATRRVQTPEKKFAKLALDYLSQQHDQIVQQHPDDEYSRVKATYSELDIGNGSFLVFLPPAYGSLKCCLNMKELSFDSPPEDGEGGSQPQSSPV